MNALVIANTLFQQHKRQFYIWTSPYGQYQNQINYILYSQRWRSSIQSGKTRLGADCGSDHELPNAKFKLKLKKVGKTTRPFMFLWFYHYLMSDSCDPVGCSPPGSSVHEIFQARILECTAFSFPVALPNTGIELQSPAFQADSLPSELPGKHQIFQVWPKSNLLL